MDWYKFKELHLWFCKESRRFVCIKSGRLFMPFNLFTEYVNYLKYSKRQFCYLPVAWFKFMWYSRKEFLL